MRAIVDRITRRDALARLAGAGALAWAATGRGEDRDRPRGRIYLSTFFRQGEARPELAGILAVDPKDGSWSQVVPGTYQDPRIAPDGRRLLCHRDGTTDEQGLYLADLAGDAPPKRIADGPVVRAFWSPDGKRVVVERRPGRTAGVWRMNADGTGRVALPIPATEMVLDWSRDGEWFVSSSSRPLEDGSRPAPMKGPVYIMHPDGTGERRLLDAGTIRMSLCFSPDSRQVLYTNVTPDLRALLAGPLHLETIDLDGQAPRTILGPAGREQPSHAVWSPDGKELAVAYSTYAGDEDPPRNFSLLVHRLAIASADGAKVRRLDFPEGLRLTLGDWR